ncbi:putative oxidoreductase [Frankia canadensis]|uniref:Putative oxidoreductase n=1 Tax=Frankia canadensis TaxID=1836972 RepID=A0A2I2L1U7_9ACTN|nr:2OG-Fe(II) oxygenase family protein [Frankia canadensis]SNQ51891.1 putative oxidoreductase [Frankia canadensis]SOU59181.1 putative oxidoreductase [Frankia canadensis]
MGVPGFALPDLVEAARDGRSTMLGELDRTCREQGVFRLTDLALPAGLPPELLERTRALFALPLAVKRELRDPDDQYVGWRGADNRNEYGQSDDKEMFHIGPRVSATLAAGAGLVDGDGGRRESELVEAALADCSLWPADLPGFVLVWHRFYAAMQHAAAQLGLALAAAMGVESARWAAMAHDNWADLAANHYPAQPAGAEVRMRNAVHSDLTLFTILLQDPPGPGGLVMRDRSGAWHDVVPAPGEFVVNIGELLTFLTGDDWWAVPHEVRPTEATLARDRLSIPFFFRPHDALVLEPFRVSPGTTAPGPIDVGAWVHARKRMQRVPS